MSETTKLAADTIHGVYEVAAIPPGVSIYLDDMIDALKSVKKGETIYGVVSEPAAERIDSEYGINHEFDEA